MTDWELNYDLAEEYRRKNEELERQNEWLQAQQEDDEYEYR